MSEGDLEKARQWYQQQQKNKDYATYERHAAERKATNKEVNVKEALRALPGGIAGAIPDTAIGLLNLGLYGAEKGAQAFGVPSEQAKTPSIPYYGHEIATKLTNKVFGEPQNENELEGRNWGNTLGGLAVGNPSNLVTAPLKLSGKTAAALIKLDPKKALAFEEAGLIPTLADVTNSKALKFAQNSVQNLPLGNLRAEQRAKKLDSFFEGVEPLNLNQTGDLLTKGAKKYNEKAGEIYNKLSEKAWKNIDRSESLPLTNTLETIQKELHAITPEARNRLAKTEAGQELTKLVEDAANYSGTLPFSDVSKVYKSSIGKLIDVGELGDNEQKALKRVYGAISKDMDEFVLARDPSALRDIKEANKFWSNFSEKNRVITNKAIKQGKKSDIATFGEIKTGLEKGNTRQADVLTRRLDNPEKLQFTHTLINEQGKLPDGSFSAQRWANTFNKMSPEAQDIALAGLKENEANKFRKVATALQHVKDTGKYANFSNTAPSAAALGTLLTLLHSPLTAAKTLGFTALSGELFSNPKVIDALYAASKVKTKDQLNKVIKHYGPVLSDLAAQNWQVKTKKRAADDENFNQAKEWYKTQQGSQNIVNPVANTESRGESDTQATKPFKKTGSKFGHNDENGEYTFD